MSLGRGGFGLLPVKENENGLKSTNEAIPLHLAQPTRSLAMQLVELVELVELVDLPPFALSSVCVCLAFFLFFCF
jgi:hypothetical protein